MMKLLERPTDVIAARRDLGEAVGHDLAAGLIPLERDSTGYRWRLIGGCDDAADAMVRWNKHCQIEDIEPRCEILARMEATDSEYYEILLATK